MEKPPPPAVTCWPAKKAGCQPKSGPTHKNVNKPAKCKVTTGTRKMRKTHQKSSDKLPKIPKRESAAKRAREIPDTGGGKCIIHECGISRLVGNSAFEWGTMARRKLEANQLTASRSSRRSCFSRSSSRQESRNPIASNPIENPSLVQRYKVFENNKKKKKKQIKTVQKTWHYPDKQNQRKPKQKKSSNERSPSEVVYNLRSGLFRIFRGFRVSLCGFPPAPKPCVFVLCCWKVEDAMATHC